jgi:hypothetical protein
MSVYYRFFIRTSSPKRVEELIVTALGGDGWLESYREGYLLPVEVRVHQGDRERVYPERNNHGSPVMSGADTGWFLLDSMISFNSPEAAAVASALLAQTKFRYPLVDLVAIDTDASDQKSDCAFVVRDASELWDQKQPCCAVEPDQNQ